MKNTTFLSIVTAIALFLFAAFAMTSPLSGQTKNQPVKIGVYDSRVVVMAYSRSAQFNEKMKEAGEKADKLMKSGDTTKMKEGALMMISRSYLLESSLFSTATTSAVMSLVKDKLPALAEKAGVSVIVSKWELNYSGPGIETVDLTGQISDLFKPVNLDPKMVKEIGGNKPMSLEEYGLGESIEMWEQFRAKYKIR